MCLIPALYSLLICLLVSLFSARTPDDSNFFQIPQKVRVIHRESTVAKVIFYEFKQGKRLATATGKLAATKLILNGK